MNIGSKWPFSIANNTTDNSGGLIKTWHLYKDIITPWIQEARQTQDSFGTGIWYFSGATDPFYCDSSSSDLQSQDAANLEEILDLIITEKFKCLYFNFAPDNNNWPDKWTSWNEVMFQQNWNFQLNVMSRIKAKMKGSGVKVLFDLSNEAIPVIDTAPLRMEYLIRLWANMTLVFGDPSNGNKTTDMTISIIPEPDVFQNLLKVWSGNLPGFVDLHIYAGQYGSWSNPYDVLFGYIEMLKNTELSGTEIVVGETNSNDFSNAQLFLLAQRDAKALGWKGIVSGVWQWAVDRCPGGVDVNTWPPTNAGAYQVILGGE